MFQGSQLQDWTFFFFSYILATIFFNMTICIYLLFFCFILLKFKVTVTKKKKSSNKILLKTRPWRIFSGDLPQWPPLLVFAGGTKWAKLWRLRDHVNGHVFKPRPVPDSRKQSPVGKHQASSSRDTSVTIQSEGQQCLS